MKQKMTKNKRVSALWAKIHVRLTLALLVGLLTSTGTAWADAQTGVNLLTNGDCANNTSDGWSFESSIKGGTFKASDGYWQGSYYTAKMIQTVTLSDKGFTAAQLDNGSLTIVASGDIAPYKDMISSTNIMVECLKDNDKIVNWDDATIYPFRVDVGKKLDSDAWKTYKKAQKLPAGTRKIRYSVEMHDEKGWIGYYGPKFDNALVALLTPEQSANHNITTNATNGTLKVAKTSLPYDPVSVSYASKAGYHMTACSMSYKDTKGVTQTRNITYDKMQTNGTTTFIMPPADAQISATFTKIPTITIGKVTGAEITASATSALPGSTITLNVKPVNSVVHNISYTPDGGTATTLASDFWCSRTLTFTMPESDVTINAITEAITASTDLTINMPTTGIFSYNIPAVYKSLTIYDDGGPSGTYSDNCNGTIELIAPEYYIIKLKGQILTFNNDHLAFYDGIRATNCTKFSNTGIHDPLTLDLTTTGNGAKLNFYSDGSVNDIGFTLNVILMQPITASPNTPELTIDDKQAPGFWATLYTEYSRTNPLGADVYYIQDGTSNDGFVKLVKLTGNVLPANNGYLINYPSPAQSLPFPYTITAATDVVTGNLLKGGITETTDNESGYLYYILGRKYVYATATKPSGYKYGFYWQNNQDNNYVYDGTKVVSAAYRAYLKVPKSSTGNAKAMMLTFGDGTTGISTTAVSAQENGAWYTLQGTRMAAEPTQHGIYIHNNKKIIIK